jgi:hypothetical protein
MCVVRKELRQHRFPRKKSSARFFPVSFFGNPPSLPRVNTHSRLTYIPSALAWLALCASAAFAMPSAPTGTPPTATETQAPTATPALGWRDMFRELQVLNRENPHVLLAKEFPSLAPEMARLGAAFAKTAYPKDATAIGQKNFLTLVKNLGMEKPTAPDLLQFLEPNKKPWPEYVGPTRGNFHMLFNTGTLNLDTSDGSSKTHPAAKLARKHLGFFTSQSRVKTLTQFLSTSIRAQKIAISALAADDDARTTFLEHLKTAWLLRHPGKPLSANELRFLESMLPFTA